MHNNHSHIGQLCPVLHVSHCPYINPTTLLASATGIGNSGQPHSCSSAFSAVFLTFFATHATKGCHSSSRSTSSWSLQRPHTFFKNLSGGKKTWSYMYQFIICKTRHECAIPSLFSKCMKATSSLTFTISQSPLFLLKKKQTDFKEDGRTCHRRVQAIRFLLPQSQGKQPSRKTLKPCASQTRNFSPSPSSTRWSERKTTWHCISKSGNT